MDDQVVSELAVIARYMVENDPEATWADLLQAYFRYKSGVDYSKYLGEPPDDAVIITLHTTGLTPKEIAKLLEDDHEYISWLLLSYGFSPMTGKDADGKLISEGLKFQELKDSGIL